MIFLIVVCFNSSDFLIWQWESIASFPPDMDLTVLVFPMDYVPRMPIHVCRYLSAQYKVGKIVIHLDSYLGSGAGNAPRASLR